jgi:hypothetical protein
MLSDEILKHQGTKQLIGFMEGQKKYDTLQMGDFRFVIDYNVVKDTNNPGYGMIIQLSESEFLFSGVGFNVEFLPLSEKYSGVSILHTASVCKNNKGQWEAYRFNGGDEILWMGKNGLKFPPNPYDIGMDYSNITIQEAALSIY